MNGNSECVEAIPSSLRKVIYEYSGNPSGEFKGYILFACDANGKVCRYEVGEGVVFDGLVQNMRTMIAEYDANCYSSPDFPFSDFDEE